MSSGEKRNEEEDKQLRGAFHFIKGKQRSPHERVRE